MSDKIKTLGEAIRYGARLKPQYFNAYCDYNKTKTCALGAALDSIEMLGKGISSESTLSQLCKRFNIDQDKSYPHPANNISNWSLFEIIISLNDQYRWSRERIADWVDEVLNQSPVKIVGKNLT